MPPLVRIEPEPQYGLVSKVGSIDLEYGVKGSELERNLRGAQEAFIKAMEARGLTLDKRQRGNPQWLTDHEGRLSANYAIDWTGERRQKASTVEGVVETTNKKETSLEETRGMVEYRIVGVFWSPERSIDILKHKKEIADNERLAKNPMSFGPGGDQLPAGRNYPGESEEQYRPDPRVRREEKTRGNKQADPGDSKLIDDDERTLIG